MAEIGNSLPEGFTFDDVLLKPGLSDVLPSEVDIRTRITRGIGLNIPIIASGIELPITAITNSSSPGCRVHAVHIR